MTAPIQSVPARPPMEVGDDAPTALYRLFNAAGVLLYVGISDNLKARFAQHAADKPWWPEVARKTVEWFLERSEAEAAEDAAIAAEKPRYNRAGVEPSLRIRKANTPAVLPDWDDADALAILRRVGELLTQDGLPHPHARLQALGVIMTGREGLPTGAALDRLAGQCGVSRSQAYRALSALRGGWPEGWAADSA